MQAFWREVYSRTAPSRRATHRAHNSRRRGQEQKKEKMVGANKAAQIRAAFGCPFASTTLTNRSFSALAQSSGVQCAPECLEG